MLIPYVSRVFGWFLCNNFYLKNALLSLGFPTERLHKFIHLDN